MDLVCSIAATASASACLPPQCLMGSRAIIKNIFFSFFILVNIYLERKMKMIY